MKERPILFSGPMVQAILAGQKTQTRRVVKPQPLHKWGSGVSSLHHQDYFSAHVELPGQREYVWIRCPYGKSGDRLWVRESWAQDREFYDDGILRASVCYAATPRVGIRVPGCIRDVDQMTYLHESTPLEHHGWGWPIKWRPSIHVPRWASRITLEIVGIRIQQLSDISHADGRAEGFDSLDGFAVLWDRINEPRGYGWHANLWVWVVEFKRL